MRSKKKTIKIGFDMDGVLVNKPPLIPKKWLEYLFRGKQKNGLHYRYPKTELEIWFRKLSHFYIFRPPIKENIEFIRKLKGQDYKLYLISSRYSFLEKETMAWLKKRELSNLFEKIFLNLNNEQPHLFKKRMLEKLSLDYFFEDDYRIIYYVKKHLKKGKFFLVNPGKALPEDLLIKNK